MKCSSSSSNSSDESSSDEKTNYNASSFYGDRRQNTTIDGHKNVQILYDRLQRLSLCRPQAGTSGGVVNSDTNRFKPGLIRLRSRSEPNNRVDRKKAGLHLAKELVNVQNEDCQVNATLAGFTFFDKQLTLQTNLPCTNQEPSSTDQSNYGKRKPSDASARIQKKSLRYRPYVCRVQRGQRQSSVPSHGYSGTVTEQDLLSVRSCVLAEHTDTESLSLSLAVARPPNSGQACAQAVLREQDTSDVNELAAYLDTYLHLPQKMSYMAESMYA